MDRIFFTVTGTSFRHGHDFVEPGMKVRLVKEPDNRHDREAIRVEMEGLGHVGYVANSVGTIVGESFSAGRLYDRIGDAASGTAVYVLEDCFLCTVDPETLVSPLPGVLS